MSRKDQQAGIVEYGAHGCYRSTYFVGIQPFQANATTLWSLRWGDASRFMVVNRVRMFVIQTAVFTATTVLDAELFIARGFTVADTGGAAFTPSGNTAKLRTNMATSLVSDVRSSNAPAGLTPGTRVLDTSPIAVTPWVGRITTINEVLYESEFDATTGWTEPIVLAPSEGLVVLNAGTVPASGSAQLSIEMDWAEVDAY